ncbi:MULTISPECIES: carboxymuconolactone decarboxylase family protein [unclassified Streptomyces]|uniref:carboxymuconolactone decarboxylase family protein n=1 Tax=unclassified Streptomyces TaxID=2593676 RepID=UPI002E331DAD|nr:carboxymuconolactone decarboxylase family protein [Streptomyces sp. NBC_01268]
MEPRLNLAATLATSKAMKHIMAAGRAVAESSLPLATRDLVMIRVSQVNGCAFCVDMHTKEATAAGETSVRLHLVAAWREATVFTEAERAALDLAEQGTRIADGAGGVTDAAWENAEKHYDEEQLIALVSLISFMNTVNRLNVITQQPAGTYEVGQLAAAH